MNWINETLKVILWAAIVGLIVVCIYACLPTPLKDQMKASKWGKKIWKDKAPKLTSFQAPAASPEEAKEQDEDIIVSAEETIS